MWAERNSRNLNEVYDSVLYNLKGMSSLPRSALRRHLSKSLQAQVHAGFE